MATVTSPDFATWMLAQETRALLTRLARVKPFALNETMVPAAAISTAAHIAIERFLAGGRRELRDRLHDYLRWLHGPQSREFTPAEAQERFTVLRMRFNDVLSQFDLFDDALSQRSEHETGVWLSGLDVAAAEALELPGNYYETPPVICYLDRGPGAAIRRARTRLPGGGENPVAVIRVPRERMIGSGVASSLVHEVGHQGSVLLGLIKSLQPVLDQAQSRGGLEQIAWQFWKRWISEILADFWAVAKVGISSTLGLIAIVSLPRYFVFRLTLNDPHPIPWIRVKLSCAIGQNLYPHPQWERLARLWESFYPTDDLREPRRKLLQVLEGTMPEFVSLVANHRPASLRGASLIEVLSDEQRQPDRLLSSYQAWRASPDQLRKALPSMVFAVIGQARFNGDATPEEESKTLAETLTYWALRSSLDDTVSRAAPRPARLHPPAALHAANRISV